MNRRTTLLAITATSVIVLLVPLSIRVFFGIFTPNDLLVYATSIITALIAIGGVYIGIEYSRRQHTKDLLHDSKPLIALEIIDANALNNDDFVCIVDEEGAFFDRAKHYESFIQELKVTGFFEPDNWSTTTIITVPVASVLEKMRNKDQAIMIVSFRNVGKGNACNFQISTSLSRSFSSPVILNADESLRVLFCFRRPKTVLRPDDWICVNYYDVFSHEYHRKHKLSYANGFVCLDFHI